MDAEPTIPQLVTTVLAIVGVFITVLQLKEHPKTRVLLFFILLGLIVGLVWYVAPLTVRRPRTAVQSQQSNAEIAKEADAKVAKEAQEIVEAQHQVDLATKQAEVFQAQRHAAEAQRERDLAAQEEALEKQHLEALQGATQDRTLLATKKAIQGSWRCGLFGITWAFNQDGTITVPIYPNASYEVLDPSHIRITQWAIATTYALELTNSEATLRSWAWTCKKPRTY